MPVAPLPRSTFLAVTIVACSGPTGMLVQAAIRASAKVTVILRNCMSYSQCRGSEAQRVEDGRTGAVSGPIKRAVPNSPLRGNDIAVVYHARRRNVPAHRHWDHFHFPSPHRASGPFASGHLYRLDDSRPLMAETASTRQLHEAVFGGKSGQMTACSRRGRLERRAALYDGAEENSLRLCARGAPAVPEQPDRRACGHVCLERDLESPHAVADCSRLALYEYIRNVHVHGRSVVHSDFDV